MKLNRQTRVGKRASALLAASLLLSAPAADAHKHRVADLARLVDPFAGTSLASFNNSGQTSPAASAPFGMLQWGPDTYPNSSSSGYVYGLRRIRGFSLTHLSGAGCPQYRDFPFLPVARPISGSPAAHRRKHIDPDLFPHFSHARERASPGSYAVRLNPRGRQPIDVSIAAATRSGVAEFRFPRSQSGQVLINAGGSAMPDDLAAVHIRPRARAVSGEASSGYFCMHRPRYRVFFFARFDRPFAGFGTWRRGHLRRRSTSSRVSQPHALAHTGPMRTAQAGAFLTFNTNRDPAVRARVGISFVSIANARRNLTRELHSWNPNRVAHRTRRAWNRVLGRIRVFGGPLQEIRTFYTSLYHAFLAPRTFSDVNGQYPGMDFRVHRAAGIQYTDFSGWDIYRSEIPLLSMLVPSRVSDMVNSLLTDAQQSGCLPRWPVANGQTMVQVGDPSDPIIASAAAFGAGGFDSSAALGAMLRGALSPCTSPNGSYVERQGLAQYEALGYVPKDLNSDDGNRATSVADSPNTVWGSASTTLEYTTADFAIAQFAARVRHDAAAYGTLMQRSANWQNTFNPASGYIEPRFANGTYQPDFHPQDGTGFVEGNSAQYTWMVPFDIAGLIQSMGGPGAAAARLNGFFTQLNAGSALPYAWLGNEPSLGTPWIYDWLGQPWSTQAVVRGAELTLYGAYPGGYPGNDDLGEMSSWYVLASLGFYPAIPGVGVLALDSPLFPLAMVQMPHGTLRISAPAATPGAPFVSGMALDGHPSDLSWISYCSIAGGGSLDFNLSTTPQTGWATKPEDAPPSFPPQTPRPDNECS